MNKKDIGKLELEDKFSIKIASSGISNALGKKLQFKLLTAEETENLGHKNVSSFKIPYFDPSGKPTNFYRIRYLSSTKKGFSAQTNAKDQRYDQPSAITTELYLPPILKRPWKEIFKSDSAIFITEGELKAAAACSMGIATIALGGVWNFCARKKGVGLLPIFDDMNLEGRQIFIVFDSDAITNPQVAAAENVLCRELINKKAIPAIVRLPALGGKKTGLDDYLMGASLEEFMALVESAEQYKYGAELHKMNEEVIYIENPSLVLRHSDGYKMAVSTFKNEVFSNRTFIDFAAEKPKSVKTAEEWMRWKGRATVTKFIYEPGEPILKNACINMWRGLPYEPKKGNIDPWLKLMDYVFNNDRAARVWFEQWLAYPLQNLGTKLFTAIVMWSVSTGTGKTLIGHTLQRLYGEDNSIMIRKRDLLVGNNSFAENKQFILGEEITGDEKRGMVDELKSLITNEEMRINIKYVPEYTIRSCANYYFTSNNPDAFFIDETDRRFFVHEIVGDPLSEQWYTGIYDPWYKSHEGAAALLHHFLHLDLTGFNPMSRAPMTVAKAEMIENSRSALANWVYTLRENPDKALKVGGTVMPNALWTTEELLRIFDPEGKSRVGVRGMGVELKRAQMTKAARGMGIRTPNGQCRLWAIRDSNRLGTASPAEISKLYLKEHESEDKIAKFSKSGRKS